MALGLLAVAPLSGWLKTPLQGVVRGYAFGLPGSLATSDALENPVRLLSAALPCALVLVLALAGRRWPGLAPLARHATAALAVLVLLIPVDLACRRPALVEALVDQNRERDAIRAFAAEVDGYSATLPAVDLAGNATLEARLLTVLKSLGAGWWFALVGAGLFLVADTRGRGAVRRRRLLPWAGAGILAGAVVAQPGVAAEYHRAVAESRYAEGQYQEALEALRASLRWVDDLAETEAVQSRLGAALFWLGDRVSPAARVFLARNLLEQGHVAQAVFQLETLAGERPAWALARRRLAEALARSGFEQFRAAPGSAMAFWARAVALDRDVLRATYALAHGHHRLDGPHQAEALAHGSRLLDRVRDRGILSDAFCLLGDAHFKARRDVEARAMYRRAIDMIPLVRRGNLGAQRGLLGL